MMANTAVLSFCHAAARAPRPVGRHPHRRRQMLARRRELDADVEHHRDVHAELFFEGDHRFGRKAVGAAVDVRLERHAVVVELAPLLQAEDLEAAGIGEDRTVPRHEAMQSARLDDRVSSRAKPQMVGVCQNDLAVRAADFVRRERLDRRRRPDRHEGRRFDHAVGEAQRTAPRVTVGRSKREDVLHADIPVEGRLRRSSRARCADGKTKVSTRAAPGPASRSAPLHVRRPDR